MNWLCSGRVYLAVPNADASRHRLNLAAHHICQNFHITMRMHRKARTWRDVGFVYHPEIAAAQPLWLIPITKQKDVS